MAKKVTIANMPETQFIDNARILGKLIKAKRTAMGMKMADCAALCNIGINTLSRIENGNANCTLAAVFSILQGLGIRLTTMALLSKNNSSLRDDEWV
jgi:transcriptional regulator with XRE-family HTH domain